VEYFKLLPQNLNRETKNLLKPEISARRVGTQPEVGPNALESEALPLRYLIPFLNKVGSQPSWLDITIAGSG
jgi:hypothetical protein